MIKVHRKFSDMPEDLAYVPTALVLMKRSVMAIIAVMFGLSLHRSFIVNINWDEFYYLSFVHLYLSGILSLQLQTFHVHLFGWLPLVSENEINQILAARVFLWLLSIASCCLIYYVAKKFCSKEAALLSVLFYIGFSYVADHGLSFRYDPICAFLFLASLYLLLAADKSRYYMPLSAVFMAVAMMVSIKSALYMGTIGAIFLARFLFEANRRAIMKAAVVYTIVFSGSFLVLYQIHSYALANNALIDPSAYIRNAGTRTLFSDAFWPRAYYILRALWENGLVWVFVTLGVVKAGYGVIKGPDRKGALFLVSFAVPLLSLLIYREAYPYFFVFLMPAVVVLGGVFADVLMANFRASGSKVLLLVLGGTVLIISASFLRDYISKLPDQTVAQADVVALVHRLFPEPVPYIDRNSMISSYPKVGVFMSTWGMEEYRAGNVPVMEDLIRREQPKFLIANSCGLDISRPRTDEANVCRYSLFDEDFETLRANFVHHWGAIYVTGKAFELRVPSKPEDFEILISGSYTLEAEAAVSIDGVTYRPGDQVHLNQGIHTIAARDAATPAVLRFGVNLYKPSHEPSPQPIYYPF